MITFKFVRWKNFLSTGNAFIEIKLNENANTLIIGENGAGKSTILDALTFGLFGKAFRKINKPLLINSINTKDCVVEVEFDSNGKSFKIIRGIKPNIFEVYCNGSLLNQDSAARDYQEHLEKFILKMNYKSFTQIVILGSASFTPFMQLSANDRRTVIEDLLDIQIFSIMNTLVKQRFQKNKEDLELNRVLLAGKDEKRSYIEKTIESLKHNSEEKRAALLERVVADNKLLESVSASIADLEQERENTLSQATDVNVFKEKHRKLIGLSSKIETNLSRVEKEKAFFSDNISCPTCRQEITETFRDSKIEEAEKKESDYKDGIEKINEEIQSCVEEIHRIDSLLQKVNNIKNDISSYKNKIGSIVSRINETEDAIEKLSTSDTMLDTAILELEDIKLTIDNATKDRESLLNDRKFIETALTLLKDGGIKTKIIKQYLPIINKTINKYLTQMGFFVNFNINEQFEETIKSRYRDEFSYHNFSEGEKMRIDLALLFTWRAVAKARNSISTNLLILDEVFDSSLDGNGTDEFLKIMWSMISDANIFVISHKTDQLFDKFQRVYRFEKHKNFSRLTI
jgi:DNA repair exonuclease SbcCD ATPase subunit